MPKIKVLAVTGVFDKVLALYRSKVKEDARAYTELSDEELVKLVQKGEDDAYSHVVERYQRKIYAYIMRLTNHRDEAHDIAQDVFLKAYKNLHRFDTDRKFSSWVYRIAHNESVNWLKKNTRVKMESIEVREENGRQVVSATDVEEEYMQKEESETVKSSINQLPARYREVMKMRYLKQLSYEEISGELKKPINTVGTLISRAKKKLASTTKLD